MKQPFQRLLAVVLALGVLAAPLNAGAQVLPQATAAQAALATYIVQLSEPPLAMYAGGLNGLAPTNPELLGHRKLEVASPASVAYRAFLTARQDALLALMGTTFGRSVEVLDPRYDVVINAVAVQLSPAEAATAASLPDVQRVVPDENLSLTTDVGPTWIGASKVWDGTGTGGLGSTKGEGVVVGIIDTGINHAHPSFAAVGGDGYTTINSRGQFYGICIALNPLLCNNKLIGLYDFVGGTGEDDNEHGSHTASTTAGNVVTATFYGPTIALTRTISGVAPHANIIAYKACTTPPTIPEPGVPPVGGCLETHTLAAIQQATMDKVDVINYSISGGVDPYNDLVSMAFLSARTAGVFASVAAGNSGPGPSTTDHNEPWTMAMAAETHNRKYVNGLVSMTGGATTPPGDMSGAGVTSGYGPAAIVYAGNAPYNDPLCQSTTAAMYSGQIVVCDRGTIGRVQKSDNVKAAGGGGFVLANDAANGDSLIGDAYSLPGVHITYNQGVTLKAWLSNGTGPARIGRIAGAVINTAAANGDVVASFSSRGPNATLPSILKPDLTAPGVDVLAAISETIPAGPHPAYGFLSGTSMATPHGAGAAALVIALHRNWSPAEVQSALMTTAFIAPPRASDPVTPVHAMLKSDSVTPADPFDIGAGRADLSLAAAVGLVLDETGANYTAANPASGGDPKTLNLASLANNACAGVCSWTRVVTSALHVSKAWTASSAAPGNMVVTVKPSSFTLAPGQRLTLTITANASLLPTNHWYFPSFSLHAAGVPESHFQMAVYAVGAPGADHRLVLHFHGNPDDGACTGSGTADESACNGPFLLNKTSLYTGTAASWSVPNPAATDGAYRSLTTPNWIWNLTQQTTVSGTMTVQWWADCAACGGVAGTADWVIRLWADGVKVAEYRVTATPSGPSTPTKLSASVSITEVTAIHDYVLHIEPVYVDTENGTHIYYDSTGQCANTGGGSPCDSTVRIPVLYPLWLPIVLRH